MSFKGNVGKDCLGHVLFVPLHVSHGTYYLHAWTSAGIFRGEKLFSWG